jgi:hypothetical protein
MIDANCKKSGEGRKRGNSRKGEKECAPSSGSSRRQRTEAEAESEAMSEEQRKEGRGRKKEGRRRVILHHWSPCL